MLREWERRHPGRVESIFTALTRVAPSHLLDRALFDFNELSSSPETPGAAVVRFNHLPAKF